MAADVGWQLLVHTAVVPISGALAWVAWQNRETRGSRELAALLVAIAIWNGLNPFIIHIDESATKHLFGGLTLAMLAAVVYYFLTFSIKYSGRGDWLTTRRRLVMALHPLGMVALTLTDTTVNLAPSVLQHSLLFAEVTLDPSTYYGTDITWGTAFYIHFVYTYALVIASLYLIIDVIRSSNSIYSGQSILLAVAALSPLLSNVIDTLLVGVTQTLGIGFAVTGILLTFAVRNHELSDITPVARDTVLDSIDGGVLVLDAENRIVDVNPVATTFLALDEDPIGRPAGEALAHLDDVWERYADVYQTHDEIAIEIGDGWRHYAIDISPLEGYASEDGTARTVLINDVTEQKQRERELENQTERLDEFAGLLSHDLRNPLTIAQGRLEMIEEESEHVDRVAESHERMNTLIDEVLTITRTGQRVTETEPVWIQETATRAWRMVETGDVELVVETDRWIEADEERLQTAFENLFRNAIEHGGDEVTRVGVGHLGVETPVFEPEEQGVYVEDDGTGIPPNDRDLILEAGHTTDSAGTGLGLSIVESVAEAHGWTVAVAESTSGGARFELRGTAIHDEQSGEQLQARSEEPSA